MPLDPMIANPTPIKLDDPLERYGNYLKSSYLMSEIAKAKNDENQNALMNKIGADARTLNPDGSRNFDMFGKLLGEQGGGQNVAKLAMDASAVSKAQAETEMNRRKGVNFQADTMTKNLGDYHSGLGSIDPTNPESAVSQFAAHTKMFLQQPATQEMLKQSGIDPDAKFNEAMAEAHQAAQGGPSGMKAWLDAQQKGVGSAYEQTVTPIDRGNQTTMVGHGKFGGPLSDLGSLSKSQTPEQAAKLALEASKIDRVTSNVGGAVQTTAYPAYGNPAAPGSVVSNTPTSMTPQVAAAPANAARTELAKNFVTQHALMQQVPQTVGHIDDALGLLSKGPITGAGQQWRLNTDRVAALIGADPGKAASDTQYLNKKLNEFVLDQMHQGNTGRTTNMLQKLVEASNATGSMEPGAIRRVLLSKRGDYQNQINIHKGNAQSLSSDPQLGDVITRIPPLPPVQEYGIPQAAIDHLKADIAAGKDKNAAAKFDKAFDQPGVAARILSGGTPNSVNPLIPGGR